MAIIVQTFYALRSHNRGIPKNDYKIYRKYLTSKSFYIFLNFLQITFQDAFSCQIYVEQQKYEKCLSNSLALKIFLGMLWTITEIYLQYIVYCFYIKTIKGFYGPFGSPPIFPDIYTASQNSSFKKGIILEVNGIKIKRNTIKENLDVGFPLPEKQKKIKLNSF